MRLDRKSELKLGIVGTGYVAQKRAAAIQKDPRAKLVAFTGNKPEKIQAFAKQYSADPFDSWSQLVANKDLDLVIVSSINCDRAAIVRAALEADKHVVAEYPLALNAREGRELIELARSKNKLLHIEHIELLGGLHRAIGRYLPEIGNVFSARYTTIAPKHPAPLNWTYHYQMYGFPLSAALSRIHRFTDLFGSVASIAAQSRFWEASSSGYYRACLCEAQLLFTSGLIANITYGKGDVFWQSCRDFEIRGDRGTLIFQADRGILIQSGANTEISLESRRGLLARDTIMVLDYLFDGLPLYVQPESSLYALEVAEAAELATKLGKTVNL
ncbi:MAG: Gfo/Idh/MocA family oxidoreductase [Prochloraceae cyanobacterium]|nr:Gfo/Idh/MocA family oxidoreductase [Prochloraceae cyanobacterium]